jgi:site-specific recombinase XerD
MNDLTLSIAIQGYLLEASARRLSPNTIKFYSLIFRKITKHFPNDPSMAGITTTDIKRFLASLTTLSKKSLLGHHAALSALWRWAVAEQIVARNIVRDIPQPVPEERVINPFTEAEVKAILAAVDKSQPYQRRGQRICQHSIRTAVRNRAIIYLLVDTGIRAEELCSLRICDADLKSRRIVVMGKGSKERIIPFAPQTGQVIWRYLATRKDEPVNATLFPSSKSGRALPSRELYHIIARIGKRAGIQDVHPHRFRHTFAITYLRNHGDIYTLQQILGHSTFDMVRRYLKIAQTDIDTAHRIASPVANWRL